MGISQEITVFSDWLHLSHKAVLDSDTVPDMNWGPSKNVHILRIQRKYIRRLDDSYEYISIFMYP